MSAQSRSALVALATAIVTAVSIDALLRQFSPTATVREVRDGIADLERLDPETVVLGSSHARTFHDLSTMLTTETPDRPPLVAIPLEYGKLTGYEWVLEHRVFPLLDEKTSDGRRRRGHVRRVILLTEWWDSCGLPGNDRGSNVPSRAWVLADYLADVWHDGFNGYNRNYLREQVRRWFPWSVVVQRRGTGRILLDAVRALAGRESLNSPARYEQLVREWQGTVEGGASCIGDPAQMASLARMLDGMADRGLDASVVLFPRNPATFTPKAMVSTFERFAEIARSVATPRGVRVIDLTTSSPLTAGDFMDDFDHVTARGNQLFARWALSNDLAFLTIPADAPPASAGIHRDGRATP